MADMKELASQIIEAVGGKENISFATHCMTRLRLILKDDSLADDKMVSGLNGVMAVNRASDQYQIVIGQQVAKLYPEIIAATGLEAQAAIDENLDAGAAEEKLTLKKVGSNILDYLSGSMVRVIPIIMVAGLFKSIQMVFGPMMLNVLPEDSHLYILLGIIYNAGMYFMPFFLAYSAAKKLGVTPVLAGMMAALILEPTFVSMIGTDAALTFLGLPIRIVKYGSSVIPILLSVWVLSYVEKFWRRVIPDMLSFVFVPFCTVATMVPLVFVVLAPLGSYISDAIGSALLTLAGSGGIISIITYTFMMAFRQLLVMTGMHTSLTPLALNSIATIGYDPLILCCSILANFCVWGIALAAFLRFRNPDAKGEAAGCFISGILGGVSEPTLFGICLKYRRTIIITVVVNAIVGLLAGLMQVKFYTLTTSSVLALLSFISPDGTANLTSAIICGAVGFVLGFIATWFFGFTKEEIEEGPQEA